MDWLADSSGARFGGLPVLFLAAVSGNCSSEVGRAAARALMMARWRDDHGSSSRVVVAISVALLVGTLLLFARSWGDEFVNYDDNDYVTANPHVTGGLTATAVRWAFATGEISYWHPLTWLSHQLDWTLFGSNPRGHHAWPRSGMR
jgi:hypothetical protein